MLDFDFLDCYEWVQNEKYLSLTLQYYPKKIPVSMQGPTAELSIYFRAPAAFLYVEWILNSRKNGKLRNASEALFISPTSGKQLLKNKFYMV